MSEISPPMYPKANPEPEIFPDILGRSKGGKLRIREDQRQLDPDEADPECDEPRTRGSTRRASSTRASLPQGRRAPQTRRSRACVVRPHPQAHPGPVRRVPLRGRRRSVQVTKATARAQSAACSGSPVPMKCCVATAAKYGPKTKVTSSVMVRLAGPVKEEPSPNSFPENRCVHVDLSCPCRLKPDWEAARNLGSATRDDIVREVAVLPSRGIMQGPAFGLARACMGP